MDALAGMKCVCPMGGDRTCPSDCPLAIWAKLSPIGRKAQRKPIAEQLYRLGFTEKAIATQLGVSDRTISEDLRNFEVTSKSTHSKTATNPKGAGRPKGGRKPIPAPKLDKVQGAVDALVADGHSISRDKIAAQFGVGPSTVQRATESAWAREEVYREIFGLVDFTKITAKHKLEAAIRIRMKELQRDFERRVQTEVKERMAVANAAVQKAANEAFEKEKWAREFMAKQKKMGTVAEWNNLMLCLHPDSRRTASDEKFDDALRWVMARRFAITGEK